MKRPGVICFFAIFYFIADSALTFYFSDSSLINTLGINLAANLIHGGKAGHDRVFLHI